MPKKPADPLFTVKLEKGLAERKRLPLSHVISVLDELRQLITEIGRDLQRRKGIANPTGDFGLELLAGASGLAFKAGSVEANIVISERQATGYKVVQSVIHAVEILDSEDFAELSLDEHLDARIVRRLNRIANIQRSDRTQMHLSASKPGEKKPIAAIFGANAMAAVRSLQSPTFKVSGSVLHGKLYHLLDRTAADNEEDKGFWGELRADNDESWRVQFRSGDEEQAAGLFKKRVIVEGTAFHYRIAHPKIICDRIYPDKKRNPEQAFDELFGCDKDLYRTDLPSILKTIHGEE
jgi:hypothetical protein